MLTNQMPAMPRKIPTNRNTGGKPSKNMLKTTVNEAPKTAALGETIAALPTANP